MYSLSFDDRDTAARVRELLADAPPDELTPTDTPDATAARVSSRTPRATYRPRPAPKPSPRARYTAREPRPRK